MKPSQLFLWDQRTLFIGLLAEKIVLSQGAATLTVSLSTPIEFKTPSMDAPMETKTLLLPPGLDVEVNTNGALIANCNLEPLLQDWRALKQSMKHHEFGLDFELENEDLTQQTFRNIYDQQLNYEDAYTELTKWLDAFYDKVDAPFKTDERVLCIIEEIKRSVDDNVSVGELAGSVGLSEPRLIQLFKQQTGVPIRRYRQWHRLFTTSVYMGKGCTLTEAAIHAGFTDSAHFTNTFKNMLGMRPSDVLAQSNGIQIYGPTT